jgi:hypothetical protein
MVGILKSCSHQVVFIFEGYLKSKLCFFSSVDNSEWTRNGDFLPTRMQAQQDAVSLICHSKTRQNPENNIGLMTLAR